MFNQKYQNRKIFKVVTFLLGTETYGIYINEIMEVLQLQKIDRKCGPPEFLEGVIYLREKVVPVMDLKNRLDIGGEDGSRKKMMILDLESHHFGVIVDDILKVLSIEDTCFESIPDDVMRGMGKEYISRIVKSEDELIVIISPDKIMTFSEKKELENFKDNMERERKYAAAPE